MGLEYKEQLKALDKLYYGSMIIVFVLLLSFLVLVYKTLNPSQEKKFTRKYKGKIILLDGVSNTYSPNSIVEI